MMPTVRVSAIDVQPMTFFQIRRNAVCVPKALGDRSVSSGVISAR
jgi:hypothetical protein